ncbi:MAG TPA: homoserine dehydrogenase, partial [Candidatus Hydrogenedentes bacterium]|nr:homoserine dehydrogenase [Candidatus Hydrogenedentota bacterium]
MSGALQVGVIGAGTVGAGVVQILRQNAGVIREKAGVDIKLVHVSDLRQEALAELDLDGVRISRDAQALIDDPEVQVVCELIGGVEPARSFIISAMNAGKHVVTANKMLLAKHGPELNEIAVSKGVELRYEASVGGVIPIIKTLRESLASNHIQMVCGILNGTCNYILSRMTYENLEFGDVLALAQKL